MKVASNVQRVGQMPLNTSLREALKLLSKPKEKSTSRPEPERELALNVHDHALLNNAKSIGEARGYCFCYGP